MEVEKYSELLQNMENNMASNQSKITDFNEGSVIYTLLSSVARVVEKLYIDIRNGFANNLRQIAYSIFGITKKSGTKATTTVVFTRAKALSTPLTISSGTIISDGTHEFETSEAATIKANETSSNAVSAQASEVGNDYNLAIGTITTVESITTETVTVTNTTRADGGSNVESETELLARFKEYINGLQGNNSYGLKSAVLSVEGVRSVAIAEHFGTLEEGIYNATIYVDDGTGNLTDTLKEEIETVVEGDNTDVNPGKRSVGINIRILPATRVEVAVAGTVKVYRTESAQALADIKSCLETQINGLGINEDVVLTTIILALRNISYIKDISNLTLNGSTENISISTNQIARLGDIDIEIEDY